MSQKWESYSTEVPGKWVLSGEHTVLRGGMAIALPHPEFKLRFEFRPSEGVHRVFTVEPDLGTLVIQDLLGIAKEWLAERNVTLDLPRGHLKIQSTIPFGAGLGSSAALSVATARWVLSACGLDQAMERDLAREMENHFHGKSSGMDVAVVSIGEPILFSMKGGAVSLGLLHLPKFVFADTGLRASTKDCIRRVEELRELDPPRGERLDAEMALATAQILKGLRAYDEAAAVKDSDGIESGESAVAEGMNCSLMVFKEWGLFPDSLESMIFDLKKAGWKACRLTGSGRGGFLVGLK